MRKILSFKSFRQNNSKLIAFGFAGLILIGSVLLALPFALKDPSDSSLLTAMFTATSALCVTGLSVVDLWNTYTLFGQAVIMILIQIGGVGFMALITGLYYMIGHKNEITSVSLLAESLGADHLSGILQIHKHLLICVCLFETIGMLLLSIRFIPRFGFLTGLWFSVFHSISAFCNAGFDLMGIIEPGSSLIAYQNDPVVCLTIAFLIILGGIGFIVWNDCITKRSYRKLFPYSKLVIWTTAFLVIAGTVGFLLLEYNNQQTLGDLPFVEKLMNAFFQSVTPRTAGFATLDQSRLTESSRMLTMIFMIIGGSAGSTAGGIKTVTALILVKCLLDKLRGKRNILLYHRSVSYEQIMHAVALLTGFLILSIFGGFYLDACCSFGFSAAVFESVSAIGTVGLSLGVTSALSTTSRMLIILLMFLGRVGILTVSVGLLKGKENRNISYPSISLING